MKRRVVVTGMGAITPLGNNVEEFWNNLKEGKCGIDAITRFNTDNHRAKLAGEVKDFDPLAYMEHKSAKRMALFSQYAVAAAKQALAQSGLDLEQEDCTRIGVSLGSGFCGVEVYEAGVNTVYSKSTDRVKPLMLPMVIPNMAAANVAIELGVHGKCTSIATACASGNQSIGEAFRLIQYGEADAMLAGGTEGSITPTSFAGFASLQALTFATDKDYASIPFDKNRGGFVMGEGAGIVVLEELSHAKARGANILAELVGYGSSCDAYHITAPLEDGTYAVKAMELALADAGVEKEQVDYINAHGTGTQANDRMETKAIKKLFGEHAKQLYVNSTKAAIGHLLGGAGGAEFIVCVKTLQEQFVHPTVNSKEPEEGLDLNYCFGAGIEAPVELAMSNAFGFGGHNAILVVKRYTDSI